MIDPPKLSPFFFLGSMNKSLFFPEDFQTPQWIGYKTQLPEILKSGLNLRGHSSKKVPVTALDPPVPFREKNQEEMMHELSRNGLFFQHLLH